MYELYSDKNVYYANKTLGAEYHPNKGESLASSKVKALERLSHKFEKDKKKYAGCEVYIRREPEAYLYNGFYSFDSDKALVLASMRYHFKHPDFILKV